MSNWEEKIEKICETTIKEDVRCLAGVPSWFLTVIHKILEKTGISNRRLYSEIAKRKIPRREKRSGSRHSDFYEKTKSHSDYIIEHYRQGENMTQIARALCMDYNTIKNVIDDAKDKKLIEEKRDCDIELEKKRSLLNTFKEKDENYDKMQKEINHLFTNYRKLQNKILVDSPLYKELVSLTNKNMPRITAPLISKDQWKLIVNEITSIYPNLYNYLFSLCPTLSDEDFQYCCFYLYGFDTNAEAKLLNIATGSVRRKHNRLKEKLNITLPSNSTLYEYLMKNMG